MADGNEVEGDDGGIPGQNGEDDENQEKEAELREQTGGPERLCTELAPWWCPWRTPRRSRRRRARGELGSGQGSIRREREPREAGAEEMGCSGWPFIGGAEAGLGFGPAGIFGARRRRSRPRRCVASRYRSLVASWLMFRRSLGRGKGRCSSNSSVGAGRQRGVRHNVDTKAERWADVERAL